MIRLVSRATLFLALGLLVASAALAGVPNAANSTQGGPAPTGIIYLGGKVGSAVDLRSEKTFTIRDAANNPVNNSVVVLNFNACYAGVFRIGNTQPFGGLTLNCGARTVSAVTNASGVAVFRVFGGSNPASGVAVDGVGEGCATVTADGVPMGSLSVATPDCNLTGGVNGSDLLFFNAGLGGTYRQRYNYTNAGGAGVINGSDLLFFNGFLFGGGSADAVTPC